MPKVHAKIGKMKTSSVPKRPPMGGADIIELSRSTIDKPKLPVLVNVTTPVEKAIRQIDDIIFGRAMEFSKDDLKVKWFKNLTSSQLNTLLSHGHIDPNESYGQSPTVKEIAEFLNKHSHTFKAHGHISLSKHGIPIVNIAAIESGSNLLMAEIIDFSNVFRWTWQFELKWDKAYVQFD